MHFLNGESTPLFEVAGIGPETELVTVGIDPSETVRYISMKMYGFNYYGIRLYNERKKTVLEISFWDFQYAEWTDLQEILAEQNIIGLKCNTES